MPLEDSNQDQDLGVGAARTRTICLRLSDVPKATKRYIALARATNDGSLPEQVRQPAEELFRAMHGMRYDVLIPCMLCGQEFVLADMTAQRMSGWVDDPRGICGECAV